MSRFCKKDIFTVSLGENSYDEFVEATKKKLQSSYTQVLKIIHGTPCGLPLTNVELFLSEVFKGIIQLSHLLVFIVEASCSAGQSGRKKSCHGAEDPLNVIKRISETSGIKANLIFQVICKSCEFDEIFLGEKVNGEMLVTKWTKDENFDFRRIINLLLSNRGHFECDYSSHIDINKYIQEYGQKLMDFALETSSLLYAEFLSIFKWDFEDKRRALEFTLRNNLLPHFQILLGVTPSQIYDEISLNSYQYNLLNSTDHLGYSLLMTAVEHSSLEILDFLLRFDVDLNYKTPVSFWTASDLAFEKKSFKALLMLLEFDAPYPTNPKSLEFCQRCMDDNDESKLEDIRRRNKSFHDIIETGDLEGIKIELSQNGSRLKNGYICLLGSDEFIINRSLLTTALLCHKYEIYSFLRSQGFSAGVDPGFDKAVNESNNSLKAREEISKYNRENFGETASKHIINFLSKTKLHSMKVTNRSESFATIKKYYEDLEKIPEVRPFLKIASYSKNCRIVFDFNQKYIDDIDPESANCSARGIFIPNIGSIYIANKNDKEEVRGTIAHELTHFVLNFKYVNKCKPYAANDRDLLLKYREILIHIRQTQMELEEEIKLAFDYKGNNDTETLDMIEAELIVRIPQLLALYCDNPEKIKYVKQNFQDLYRFYCDHVLEDIIELSERLENKQNFLINDLEIMIKDEDIKFFEKVSPPENIVKPDDDDDDIVKPNQILVSNNSILTFLKVYQTFQSLRSGKVVVFARLERLEEEKYFKNIHDQTDEETTLVVVQTKTNEEVENFEKFKELIESESKEESYFEQFKRRSDNKSSLPLEPREKIRRIDVDPDTTMRNKLKQSEVGLQENSSKMDPEDRTMIDESVKREASFRTKWILILQDDLQCSDIIAETQKTHLTHSWSDLSKEFKRHLLKTKISLRETRGENLFELKYLLEPEASLSNSHLKQLMTFERVAVNKVSDKLIPYFIGRSFELHESMIVPVQEETVTDLIKDVTIIGNVAGMGKSITMIHFLKVLSTKFPDHWVSLIDLKQKSKKFKNIFRESLDNFAKYFTENLLDPSGNDLEKLIFESLFKKRRVILLLDGFDEISPKYKEFVIEMIKSYLTVKGNKLIIATRMHLLDDLKEISEDKSVISLNPFTDDDQIEFFTRFWEFKQQKKQMKSTEKYLRESAIEVLESFKRTDASENLKSLVGIPLQARMLAEITEEFVLYHQLSQFEFEKKMNLFEFYEKFLKKLLEDWKRKLGLADKDNVDNIMDSIDIMGIHYAAAINAYNDFNNVDESKLPAQIKSVHEEVILRFGILQTSVTKNLEFIHGSFADFLIVRFFIARFFNSKYHWVDVPLFCDILINVLIEQEHEITRSFLSDALKDRSTKQMTFSVERLSEVFYTAIELKNAFNVLHRVSVTRHFNTIYFFLDLCSSSEDYKKSIERIMQVLMAKDLDKNTTFLIILNCFKSAENLGKFLKHLEEIFLSKSPHSQETITSLFQKLFLENGFKGLNPLHEMVTNSNKNLYFKLLDFLKEKTFTSAELQSYVSQKDAKGFSIVFLSANPAFDSVTLNRFYGSLKECLSPDTLKTLFERNNLGENAFHIYCSSVKCDLIEIFIANLKETFSDSPEKISDYLSSADIDGDNALHYMYCNKAGDDYARFLQFFEHLKNEIPERFKEMLLQRDSFYHDPLTFILRSGTDENVLKAFWSILAQTLNSDELKLLLQRKTIRNQNIFLMFDIQENPEFWGIFFEIIKTHLGSGELKDMLTFCDSEKRNVLHHVGQDNKSSGVMKILLKGAKEVMSPEDFKMFLVTKDSAQNTALHLVNFYNTFEVIKALWSRLEIEFSKEELKAILLSKNDTDFGGSNAFIESLYNKNFAVSKFIWDKTIGIFEADFIRELLLMKAGTGETPVCLAASRGNDILLYFLSLLRQNMNDETFISVFIQVHSGFPLLHIIVWKFELKFVQSVINFLQCHLDEKQIKEIFLQKDHQNRNILRICEATERHENLKACRFLLGEILSTDEFETISESLDFSSLEIGQQDIKPVTFESLLVAIVDKDEFKKHIKKILKNDVNFITSLNEENSAGKLKFHLLLSSAKCPLLLEALWNFVRYKVSITDQKTLLTKKSSSGEYAMTTAISNKHCNMLKPLLQCIELTFKDPNEVKDILRQKYANDETLLHLIARNGLNDETEFMNKNFFPKISEYFKGEELESFLNSVDRDQNHVLHIWACFKTSLFFILYIRELKGFSDEEKIFGRRNGKGKNIVACLASIFEDKDVRRKMRLRILFRYVWNQLSNALSKETLLELLMNKDTDELTAVHYLAMSGHDDMENVWEYILEWLQKNFDFKTVIENYLGTTEFLFFITRHCESEIARTYLNFLEKNYSKDELLRMIQTRDPEGNDIFDLAEANENDENIGETFKSFLSDHFNDQ